MWHFLCVFENVQRFLPPKCFLQDIFHSTNTLYVKLPYHATDDKVNEFDLSRFMLVLGVYWFFSVVLGSWWLGTPKWTDETKREFEVLANKDGGVDGVFSLHKNTLYHPWQRR